MRFLVDEDLPGSIADVLQQRGHEAVSVVQTGLGGSSDSVVAAYAQVNKLCLITCDLGFADIRNYPPVDYSGILVLRLPTNATTPIILDLLERLLKQTEIVEELPGKLAIVESGKIRLRKG